MRAFIQNNNAQKKCTVSDKGSTKASLSSGAPLVDSILSLQRNLGNRAVQRLLASKTIQSKLKIGQPDDIYEQEADRVAEEVMLGRSSTHARNSAVSPVR